MNVPIETHVDPQHFELGLPGGAPAITVSLSDGDYFAFRDWVPLAACPPSSDAVCATVDGVVTISKGPVRRMIVSLDDRQLDIQGPDLQYLNEISLLGMLLNFWRYVGIHYQNRGWQLLHASAAQLPDGTAVLFCDDDGHLGANERSVKTLPTLAVSLEGGKYIGDEMVLFHPHKRVVSALPGVPIRLREKVIEHFATFYHRKLLPDRLLYRAEDFGLTPGVEVPVHAAVYLHLTQQSRISRLTFEDATQRATITCMAHFAKLVFPSLDRARFDTGGDSAAAKNLVAWSARILERFPTVTSGSRALAALPALQVDVSDYREIVPLLSSALGGAA